MARKVDIEAINKECISIMEKYPDAVVIYRGENACYTFGESACIIGKHIHLEKEYRFPRIFLDELILSLSESYNVRLCGVRTKKRQSGAGRKDCGRHNQVFLYLSDEANEILRAKKNMSVFVDELIRKHG